MGIQAYVDDSGKGGSPVFVLAGFVASAERWAAFSDDWRACLDADPPLALFKMKEAASGRGEFHRLSEEQRDERLRRFVEIIDRHVPVGVACVVKSEDYRAMFKGRGSKQIDSPYFLAFYGIMSLLVRVQAVLASSPHPVDFIFDEQGKEVGRALAHWKRFRDAADRAEVAHLLGNPPISRSDRDVLPLQAADMLAWRVRRHFADEAAGVVGSRLSRLPPFTKVKVATDTWTRERMNAVLVEDQSYSSPVELAIPGLRLE